MKPHPAAAIALVAISPDAATTRRLGRDLAHRLAPGDVVLLDGDLGSGKTELVRGLAEGLGADASEVASPTFALVHEYGPEGAPPLLAHADFFRLESAEARLTIGELGLSELRSRGAVLVIEWPLPPWTGEGSVRVRIDVLPGGARRVRVAAV